MQAKFVGRWVPSGNSMTTGYPGSSFSFRVSGTSYVNVSISGATRIAYKVDDEAYVVTNNVQITGLTLSTHKIKIVLTTSAQTWAGNNYAQVTGIEVASGGSIIIEPATKRKCLVFGDSITEGWNITAKNKITSELTWWNKLSDMLNMDITPVGIGGIGFTTASNTYPSVKSVPSYIENITSLSVVSNTDYDLVIIELGTNDRKSKTEVDSDFVTDVTSVVNRIKSKYPNADIHALIPFTLNGQPSLNQAYGNTNVNIIPTSWYSSVTFADAFHPNNAGNATIANNVKSYLISKYGESYFKEVTMKRIDTVYIDTSGVVQKATGTMANNPVKPSLPSGAIRVADIVVEQGASTGTVVDNRDWLKVYDNLSIVNVKDYGAKGDGVADDTAAIQSAIDNNPHCTITFPNGTYLISSPIKISSNKAKKVSLNLSSAEIKASDNFPANSYMLDIGATGGGSWGSDGFLEPCRVYGGHLIGGTNTFGGVRVKNISMVHLFDMYINNIAKEGIRIDPAGENKSSDAYINTISISGTGADGSVGLIVAGYDNKICRVRTALCQTGVKTTGGGNYYTEIHPLGWHIFTDTTTGVGFYDNGVDNQYHQCYSDGFDIAFENGSAAKRGRAIDMFVLYASDRNGIFYKCGSYDARTIFVRAVVNFNANKENTIVTGAKDVRGEIINDHAFIDCRFLNIRTEDSQLGSPLIKGGRLRYETMKQVDWNVLMCEGTYALAFTQTEVDSLKNTLHLPYSGEAMYGVLTIESIPSGWGAWGVCRQVVTTQGGKIYSRGCNFQNVEAASWSAWKKITTT